MRPAYLQLHQTADDGYVVFWKVPALGDSMRLSLYVQLPATCSNLAQPRGFFSAGAYTEQWSVTCPGGLSGSTIRIDGLAATLTDVLVRVERLDGSAQIARLTSSSPSFVVEAAPRRFEVARTYLVLGIEHILTGVDHLLFVSGSLLLVTGFRAPAPDRQCLHAVAHGHADPCHTRFCPRAARPGGSGHCPEHFVCGLRSPAKKRKS